MREVALILTILWGGFFLICHKRLGSSKVLFAFLFAMVVPSWFAMHFLDLYIAPYVNYLNVFVMGCLLLLGALPWMAFDRLKRLRPRSVYVVNDRYIQTIRVIFRFLIVSSLFSICYLLPYAMQGIAMGAQERRTSMADVDVLPPSILTTFVVGFAALNIYNILGFYISCIDERLKRYRIWLMVSSLSYVINCFAFAGRDGLILLPTFYVIFFLVFKDSLPERLYAKLRKQLMVLFAFVGFFLASFTASRFFSDDNVDDMYNGTIGYIAQQPYVFDYTVQDRTDFHGWELRFPIINRILGVPKHDITRVGGKYDTYFGTMYSEFYSVGGWWSLCLISFVFIAYYTFSISYLRRHNRIFGLLLMFAVYLYIEVTGLFYCKAGSKEMINLFYAGLSILPFFVKNYIILSDKSFRC